MGKSVAVTVGIVISCLVFGLAVVCTAPHRAGAEDTVKIGILDPQSGPAESVGRFYRAAIEFAVDEQNKKGGLLGKKIELFSVIRPVCSNIERLETLLTVKN